jgi:hypothetical protein
VTQTAIVSGGTQIGRVVCGAANVYPLAVDVASAAPAPPALPTSSSDGGGGMATAALIAAAALALVGSQILIGRKIFRQKGDAAA